MEEYGENERRDEIQIGDSKPVPMDIANKAMKSICKIIIKGINNNYISGSGFFMKISKSLKCLITNYHVIPPNIINQNIELQLLNEKKMKLDISNRYIQFLKEPKDTTIIQIKETDSIYKDIEFLGYDSNYKDNGYDIYKEIDVFTLQHPLGNGTSCASGIIKEINPVDYEIDNKYFKLFEFAHNIPTEQGSSGCPNIIINKNINLIQVIGIHKEGNYEENINYGTFIGEIIKDINKNYINKNDDNIINDNNINSLSSSDRAHTLKHDTTLPGGVESVRRTKRKNKNNINDNNINNNLDRENINKPEEKKENNDNAIIGSNNNNKDINNLNINSTPGLLANEQYYTDEEIAEIIKKLDLEENNKKNEYKPSENYIIAEIYINQNNINKEIRILNSFEERMRCKGKIFAYFNKYEEKDYINENEIRQCEIKINDISIPFSYKYKFTKYGKNIIKYTFKNLLTRTDLLFEDCNSLSYIDLSHFNSKNVTNVYGMFLNCTSLTNINFTNFNTQNVKIFRSMFDSCTALTDINLTSFNTKNAVNMRSMFGGCSSLQCIDLSNFNTENVIDMSGLFSSCTNLEIIILSNLNTKNVTDMSYMFNGCDSLSYIDLSNFNTQNVINMEFMFAKCNSIKDLNLSSFTTRSSTKLNYMFTNSKFIKGGKIIANDDRIKQKINEVYNSKNFDPVKYWIDKLF